MRLYEEPIWASVRWCCMQSAGRVMLYSPSLLFILLFFLCGAVTKTKSVYEFKILTHLLHERAATCSN